MPRTATKKTTVRKASPKATSSYSLSNIKLKNLGLVFVIVVILFLLGIFKNQFVVATVNGRQINRLQLIGQLEKQDGKRVLDSMITEELIKQEAEKRKVTVSDQEVNNEFKKIEKNITDQGQNLDQLLAAQNLDRNQLMNQIKLQLLLKKMINQNDLKVGDKEIQDYIDKNKSSIPENANMDQIKSQVKDQLQQQKLNEKIQGLIQDLKQKAKIDYLSKF